MGDRGQDVLTLVVAEGHELPAALAPVAEVEQQHREAGVEEHVGVRQDLPPVTAVAVQQHHRLVTLARGQPARQPSAVRAVELDRLDLRLQNGVLG